MLVLSRNVGQTLIVGDDVHIRVIEVKGKSVRLGIVAPTAVPVFREEIFHRIQEEKIKDAV